MADDRRVWEKTDTRRVEPIFDDPYWKVEYTDQVSGKQVVGIGKTLEQADKDAQRKLW
jgi:hypothetical protein